MPRLEPDAPAPSDANELPAWALTFAAAALRCGQTAAQIEAGLVGKGLSPREAAAAVVRCLEIGVGREWQSLRRTARLMTLNRCPSLAVALGVVILVAASVPANVRSEMAIRAAGASIIPVAFIWFSQAFGGYGRGSLTMGYIRPTPRVFLAVGGWLLLVVLLGAVAYAFLSGQDWNIGAGRLRDL
jgi:hypothetical protein